MNEDIAFCLERFADEQIAEGNKEIEEDVNELEIEQIKLTSDINHNEIAICQRENNILEQFSTDLKENNTSLIKSRGIIEKELRDILNRASFNIDAIAAKAVDKQTDEEIRTASNRLRRQNEQFESEVTQLINTIDQSTTGDCSTRIINWSQQHFKYIEDLNRSINNNENSGLSKDKLIQYSFDREHLWKNRYKLIYDFIQQLQIEDSTMSQYFIDALNDQSANVNEMIKFARLFVQERQEERRYLKEEPLREIDRKIEEKHLEQQTRAIQLAAALRQLSVGSPNQNQFNQRFKQILDQSKTSEKVVPIVLGHIDQPTIKELPLIIRLDANFDTWASNKSAIQQQFCSALSNAFELPKDTIRIVRVEQGSAILHALVQPPYGQVVINKLSNTDSTSSENIDIIQKCCSKFNSRIYSITLGEFGLNVEKRVMDTQWNKVYVNSHGQPGGTFWTGSLNRGGKPYFCPKGWTRYGIKVSENDAEFDAKWGSWHIAYHGTRGANAPLILETGLRTSISGCFAIRGRTSVYLTPSIEYAAHPRYALPWKKNDDKNQWYQLVFQCRVNPKSVGKAHRETLISTENKEKILIDENFSNDQLTWIIPGETADVTYIRDNIICYGMMVRKTKCDPKELPVSKWWQYSGGHNYTYDSV